MTRNDVVDIVAAKTGVGRAVAAEAVAAILDAMLESLARGEDVQVARFGRLSVRTASARPAVNPRTGVRMTAPARRYVALSAYRELREAAVMSGACPPRP